MTEARWPKSVIPRARRAATITLAFLRMGIRAAFSYPLSFVISVLGTMAQVFVYYFLGHLIGHSSNLGVGYLTFASVGLAANQITSTGINGLGQELDWAIQQGRLEMFLIEPISWRIIPVALSAWPVLYGLSLAALILLISWALGATLVFGHLAVVLALVVLGIGAGLVLGIAAGSLRVLAKRGDPTATLYGLAVYVLGGVVVPINVLPSPLRALSWFLPTMYVTAGLRKALIPDANGIYGPDPTQAALILLAMCVVLLPLSLWFFGRSLDVGRRYGVLAGY